MPSILSCLHSIRALLESGEVSTPHSVLDLFLPWLARLPDAHKGIELVLADALLAYLMREEGGLSTQQFCGMRKELEKRAQPHCSAGDLDVRPLDVISHAVSFLSYEDRLSVECVCRSLFAISRNTPICVDLIQCASRNLYDYHVSSPKTLCFTASPISEEKMGCLDMTRVEGLAFDAKFDVSRLMSHSFPCLEYVTYSVSDLDRFLSEESGHWQFISKHRISHLCIARCSSVTSDHWNSLLMRLSQNRNLSNLKLQDLSDAGPAKSKFRSLKRLHFWCCDMSVVCLNSIVHPRLKVFSFVQGNLRSPEDGSDPDWSFFDLPRIREIKLQCSGCLTLKALNFVIENYGPKWPRLRVADLTLGHVRWTELCTFVKICSVLKVPRLSLVISELKPDEPSSEMTDISISLSHFPNLKIFDVRCTEVDPRAEEIFHRMIVRLYHLHHSSDIDIRLLVDNQQWERFKQAGCKDGELVRDIRRWVRIESRLRLNIPGFAAMS